jgi:hypothetical protein
VRDKLLTDVEVFLHLNALSSRKIAEDSENLQTIILEVQAYLRDRPAGNTQTPQSIERMTGFLKELHEYGISLEKAEKLQIINSAPSSIPVLYTLVEECEERLSEEKMSQLVSLSQRYLGYEPMPGTNDE